jgi:hypothetical protein
MSKIVSLTIALMLSTAVFGQSSIPVASGRSQSAWKIIAPSIFPAFSPVAISDHTH